MTTASLNSTPRRSLAPIGATAIAIKAGAAILCGALALATARHLDGTGFDYVPSHNVLLYVHLATVIPAIPLGAYVLTGVKGTARHRLLGRIWAILMLVTAVAAFLISGLSLRFNPIQLFSVLVVYAVVRAVTQARNGQIERHRKTMLLLYTGMLIAGAFTFAPGRLFGSWLLG